MMNDIFNSDAFSLQTLTAAINEAPFTPSLVSSLGLFEEDGIATLDAAIEIEKGVINLVPVTPRGAPAASVNADKRRVYTLRVPHLPETATLLADSVQGRRAFGQETGPMNVQTEVNKRLAKMRRQIDYTIEAHRLSAIKGNFYDANGDQVSLYTYFGVAQQTVAMALTTAATKVRQKCLDIVEAVETGLDGIPYTGIEVLCGKNFWRELIEHDKVRDTYANYEAAAALRGSTTDTLVFGDISWRRYRGDSSGAVSIGADDAYALPTGVAEMYLTRYAPANYADTVNTEGLPYYAASEVLPMGKGVTLEAQSNPLNIITRPRAVVKLSKV